MKTLIVALTSLATIAFAEEGFIPLFNGKDFTGWEQHSGKAEQPLDYMFVLETCRQP